jgi:hypothetical protein
MPLVLASPVALNEIMSAIMVGLNVSPFFKVSLFQNNYVPTPTDTIATYTEATFDGYAAVHAEPNIGPYREDDGSFTASKNVIFTMSGSTTPNTIYGYWLEDLAGHYFGAYRFAQPVQMVDEFSFIQFLFGLTLKVGGISFNNEPA